MIAVPSLVSFLNYVFKLLQLSEPVLQPASTATGVDSAGNYVDGCTVPGSATTTATSVHSTGEMYCGHGCLSLCVVLSRTAFLHYCMYLDVTLGNGRGCPLVVHY